MGENCGGLWEIIVSGSILDYSTVEEVLPAYEGLGAVEEGRMIHGLVYKIGIKEDRKVRMALLFPCTTI